jgi:hypothetical protein
MLRDSPQPGAQETGLLVSASRGRGSRALSAVAGIATLGLVLVLAAPMPATALGGRPEAQNAGPGPASADQAILSSLRAAVADGLQLLRDVPLLRSTTIATTLSQFTQGLLPIALPLLAVRLDHPAPAVLVAALAACGACLAALAMAPGFDLALGLAVLAGAAEGPSLAATLTIRQRTVPPERYAQTAATTASLKTGAYALGAAVAGLLAGVLTARQLVLLVGIGQGMALVPLLSMSSSGPAGGSPMTPRSPLCGDVRGGR